METKYYSVRLPRLAPSLRSSLATRADNPDPGDARLLAHLNQLEDVFGRHVGGLYTLNGNQLCRAEVYEIPREVLELSVDARGMEPILLCRIGYIRFHVSTIPSSSNESAASGGTIVDGRCISSFLLNSSFLPKGYRWLNLYGSTDASGRPCLTYALGEDALGKR